MNLNKNIFFSLIAQFIFLIKYRKNSNTQKNLSSSQNNIACELIHKGDEQYNHKNYKEAIKFYTLAVNLEKEKGVPFSETKYTALQRRAMSKYEIDDIESAQMDNFLASLEGMKSNGPYYPE